MNRDADFSMDEFMANILKTTKAVPVGRKRQTVATSESTADGSVVPVRKGDTGNTAARAVSCDAATPTLPQSGLTGLVSLTMRAKQTVEQQMANGEPSKSAFSQVFCHPESKQEPLKTTAAPTNEGIKVAAYIRVSTDSADQENSYETQERYFNRLLSSNKEWVSVGIYSDYGISGTSKDKRTGFKRLLRHCREGRINRIVCKSISRFARNTADFLTALKVLKDSGVTILFEKESLDTADPMNDFVVTTLAAVAQQETFSISENIRIGIVKRHLNGEAQNLELYGYCFNGNVITTDSGYKYKDVDIVEAEAAVVRRIFKQLLSGYSFQQVATQLNTDGIPAPKQRTNRKPRTGRLRTDIDTGWTASRVSYIARNERYTGDIRVQKTYTEDCLTHRVRKNKGDVPQYVIHNHHPAIIDRELYDRTAAYLATNRRVNTSAKGSHELSGMLVCAHCGRFFNVRNSRNPIWFCPSTALNNGKNICSADKIYESEIKLMLRKAVTTRFNSAITTLPDTPASNLRCAIEAYATSRKGFVNKMCGRLEAVQKHDNTERDRAYLGKRLTAIRLGNEAIERRIALLKVQKEAMLTRRTLLHDDTVTDKLLTQKTSQIEAEQHRLANSKEEETTAAAQFSALEDYWEALENSYEERERAIKWMQTLDENDFFNELLSHIRAFIFTITVHSASHFTIHWFDNSTSEVKLRNNAKKTITTQRSTKRQPTHQKQ